MEINSEDAFLLTMAKAFGKKIKWIMLGFAVITITVIGILYNKNCSLRNTIYELQETIQILESND